MLRHCCNKKFLLGGGGGVKRQHPAPRFNIATIASSIQASNVNKLSVRVILTTHITIVIIVKTFFVVSFLLCRILNLYFQPPTGQRKVKNIRLTPSDIFRSARRRNQCDRELRQRPSLSIIGNLLAETNLCRLQLGQATVYCVEVH